jgi:hypothetical protein
MPSIVLSLKKIIIIKIKNVQDQAEYARRKEREDPISAP